MLYLGCFSRKRGCRKSVQVNATFISRQIGFKLQTELNPKEMQGPVQSLQLKIGL